MRIARQDKQTTSIAARVARIDRLEALYAEVIGITGRDLLKALQEDVCLMAGALSSARGNRIGRAAYYYCVIRLQGCVNRLQQGHRGNRRANAVSMMARMVAMELVTCRSGLIGGSPRSPRCGNGRRREAWRGASG